MSDENAALLEAIRRKMAMQAQLQERKSWEADPAQAIPMSTGAPPPPAAMPSQPPAGMPSQAGPGGQSAMDPMLQAAMKQKELKMKLANTLAGAVGKNENTGEQGPLGLSGGADHWLVKVLADALGNKPGQ